jgi:NAD(P)-dependent dehydrogenase (short-subunit alcohol dehydrogenase family)
MGRLEGRVAIVTGGGSGIGRATCLALAREGAAVVVADVDEASAKRVAEEVAAAGGRARPQWVDVAEEPAVAAMVEAAVGAFGGLDVLHNNAALLGNEAGRDADVVSMDVATWDRAMAVNLRGVMLGCKHAIPAMIRRGGGSIVNTSTGSTLAGDLVRTAYVAAKAGVNVLTKYVATQYGKQNIRCNAVLPGLIRTPAATRGLSPELISLYEEHTLLPRIGEPEDIAKVVVFLASDDAAFVTGQEISVDGGIGAHNSSYADLRRMLGKAKR